MTPDVTAAAKELTGHEPLAGSLDTSMLIISVAPQTPIIGVGVDVGVGVSLIQKYAMQACKNNSFIIMYH